MTDCHFLISREIIANYKKITCRFAPLNCPVMPRHAPSNLHAPSCHFMPRHATSLATCHFKEQIMPRIARHLHRRDSLQFRREEASDSDDESDESSVDAIDAAVSSNALRFEVTSSTRMEKKKHMNEDGEEWKNSMFSEQPEMMLMRISSSTFGETEL